MALGEKVTPLRESLYLRLRFIVAAAPMTILSVLVIREAMVRYYCYRGDMENGRDRAAHARQRAMVLGTDKPLPFPGVDFGWLPIIPDRPAAFMRPKP